MSATLNDDFPPMHTGPGWNSVDKSDKPNHFTVLAAIDVSAQVEKKNNLSYLSWAWAVDRLLRADPNASWTYGEPVMMGQTMMVFCTVTAFGKPMTMQLPVMDYKNKAIPNPDAFAVNTAMQRCLVKAIALHGLGLYIYAGEDLPYDEGKGAPVQDKGKGAPPQKESFKSEPKSAWDKLDAESQEWMCGEAAAITVMTNDGDIEGAYHHLESLKLDIDDKTAFWSRLDSKQRSALKAYSAIIHAGSLSVLEMAWKATPNHSIAALRAVKDKRKAELSEPEQAAA